MVRPSEARNTRNVVILTGVGHFSTHFFELMFPTLAVALAAQAHVPLEEVLGWSFLGYLLFGLGALPAGLLADRIGSRLLLIVGMFGLGVASLTASEVPNPRALSFCLAAMGACASIYHPAGMSLISHTIPQRGRALGVNGVFGNVAIALTPLITATLCAQIGWQHTYRLVGYVMCAVAVGCAFLRIDERREHIDDHPAAARPPRREMLLPFVVLMVAATLAGISYRGNTLLMPGYFAARVSEMSFGAATSLAYALGIGGQYVGGRLADRYDLRRLYVAFHAISLPALLLMTVSFGFPLIGCAALFVFFSLGMQPIENSLFAHYTPPRWRATAFGFKFVCTFGIGAFAVWLVQWADSVGGLSFAVLCLCGVVAMVIGAAACLLVIGERRLARPGGRAAVAPVFAAGAVPPEPHPSNVAAP